METADRLNAMARNIHHIRSLLPLSVAGTQATVTLPQIYSGGGVAAYAAALPIIFQNVTLLCLETGLLGKQIFCSGYHGYVTRKPPFLQIAFNGLYFYLPPLFDILIYSYKIPFKSLKIQLKQFDSI